MSPSVTIGAPAKINLRLTVLAREASGYHQIETVFHALELADELSATLANDGIAVDVEGADVGPVGDNLVTRAARRFQETVNAPAGVRFQLLKRIPAGAGLGGGSSDAAAALRALNVLCNDPIPAEALAQLGANVGSDVPFFLCGSPHAVAWGRGQRLLPLPPLPARPVLLAVPPFTSATAEAYRRLAGRPPGAASASILSRAALLRWEAVAASAANDFEPVMLADHPSLAAVRDALRDGGAAPALLAGSGSALFGVFQDEPLRDQAADRIARDWPEWHVIRTRTAAPA